MGSAYGPEWHMWESTGLYKIIDIQFCKNSHIKQIDFMSRFLFFALLFLTIKYFNDNWVSVIQTGKIRRQSSSVVFTFSVSRDNST